jgi:hypothetical protein
MKTRTATALAIAALMSGFALTAPASADDDLSHFEWSELRAAMAAIGCYGTDVERESYGSRLYYEVDDARCRDGREYDLKFSRDFYLIGRRRD